MYNFEKSLKLHRNPCVDRKKKFSCFESCGVKNSKRIFVRPPNCEAGFQSHDPEYCGMHEEEDQEALGIRQDMALASFDPLARGAA
ncbi:hypothetical protein [Acetobacter fallax]|uniref:hypothetical protein n=1 Tax=Acetobacter fallax TaxID=1737473 RepID=UPI0038D23EC3